MVTLLGCEQERLTEVSSVPDLDQKQQRQIILETAALHPWQACPVQPERGTKNELEDFVQQQKLLTKDYTWMSLEDMDKQSRKRIEVASYTDKLS